MSRTMAWLCVMGLAACAAAPAGGGSLAGTSWVGADKELASLDASSSPRLEFVGEGRVSGYTGCNMLSATWRMEGAVLRFDMVSTTKRGCLGPAGDVEKRVLAALNSGTRGRREGGRLILEGTGGARFEFVEAK